MRVLEVRRHSLTKRGPDRGRGSHLSPAGVQLARAVGAGIGPFDRVFTSPVPRTGETALAMGFAVDDCAEVLGALDDAVLAEIGHHDRWSWSEPFQVFARLAEQGGATARLGMAQAEYWQSVAASLPEEGRALLISHGRILEAGAVTCLPGAPFGTWGPPFRHCEGLRLTWNGSRFGEWELLRVDERADQG